MAGMDKDNPKDFTFAKSSSLKFPVTFRMYVLEQPSFARWTLSHLIYILPLWSSSWCLSISSSQFEGNRKPRPYTEIIDNPDLQFAGVQQSP